MAVDDDKAINEFEAAMKTQDIALLTKSIAHAIDRTLSLNPSDKKFRAFMNQLWRAGGYTQFRSTICNQIEELVIPCLRSNPDRARDWVKLLSASVNVGPEILHALEYPPASMFDWQRMWLWEYFLSMEPGTKGGVLDHARQVVRRNISPIVTSRAIVLLAREGDSRERSRLWQRFIRPGIPNVLQRAGVIAASFLGPDGRSKAFAEAESVDWRLRYLSAYLESNNVTFRRFKQPIQVVPPKPNKLTVLRKRGIGVIQGKTQRFVLARSDMDYD